MSTLAYAISTTKREQGTALTGEGTSRATKAYVDAMAALVPAEVLALHAAIISITTKTAAVGKGEITEPLVLAWAFWAMLALAVVLYVVPRTLGGKWDQFDWLRMLIPAFAFAAWTMMQPVTAFDAAFPESHGPARTVVALILAVLLGLLAASLGYKIDKKEKDAETALSGIRRAQDAS